MPTAGILALGNIASNTGFPDSVKASFDEMISNYRSDHVDGVPLFITLDLHGSNYEVVRLPHNYDSRMFSIVLGDLCGDEFNTTQIASIKATHASISNIVSVAGNHDVFVRHTNPDTATYYAVNGAFKSTNAKRADNKLYNTVLDNWYGGRYLVVSSYRLPEEHGGTHEKRIDTAEMTWLLGELSADDGYDIVVCPHEPFDSSWVTSDGETRTDAG